MECHIALRVNFFQYVGYIPTPKQVAQVVCNLIRTYPYFCGFNGIKIESVEEADMDSIERWGRPQIKTITKDNGDKVIQTVIEKFPPSLAGFEPTRVVVLDEEIIEAYVDRWKKVTLGEIWENRDEISMTLAQHDLIKDLGRRVCDLRETKK